MFTNVKELLPKEKGIFDDSPETISFFQAKLGEKLKELQEKKDILILDFWKLDIPRLRTFDKGFRPIYEKKEIIQPIVLVNVEKAKHLQKSPLEDILFNANTVMPVVSPLGEVYWIGVKDERLKNICNLLFEGVHIEEKDIDSNIDSFLKKNSWLSSFNKRGLFKKISEKFEMYLREKLFQELDIKKEGHYLLPSGGHCQIAFNTPAILTDPKLIEDIAFEICRRVKGIKIQVILCHSLLATCVGKEIARILGIDYYTALGYPFPICHFDESKISDRQVLILSTLIRSGTTIRNLQDYVKQEGGKIGKVITLLDTRELNCQEIETEAIISYPIEYVTEEKCSLCKEGRPLESIDYFTGIPLPIREEEHLPSLLKNEEFWEIVVECDALQEGHLQVNGHHFSLFIETNKIFKNEVYLTKLSNTLLEHFDILFDAIVYPLNESAILFATKLAALTDSKKEKGDKTVIIPVCKNIETNDFIIPEIYREEIEGKTILIIDDGANFGNTMIGMHFAAKEYNPKIIKHAVFVNRLGTIPRKILNKVLHEDGNKSELTSLFYLYASPVYRPWECPMCNKLEGLKARQKRTTLSSEAKNKISSEISKLTPITVS